MGKTQQTPNHGQRKKIRLFVVEDDNQALGGVRLWVATDPSRNIELVGEHGKNTPDLPRKVLRADPDVVLVDGVLQGGIVWDEIEKFPESDGIAACQAIRKQMGRAIKIVLYTHWPQLRRRYNGTRCADHFVLKGLDADEFRAMIWLVYFGKEPPDKRLKDLIGIELIVERNQVILKDESGKEIPVSLQPAQFDFVRYLALARARKEDDWVTGESGRYRFSHGTEWRRIKFNCNDEQKGDYELDGSVLAGWAARINGKVRPLVAAQDPRLIIGPDTRGPHAKGTFSLNPGIRHILPTKL